VKLQGVEEKRKKIGQYLIIREIGKGGFAQVFEVEDPSHRRYALKEYNLQNSVECFHNEANIGQFFFEEGKVR
jgi:serine/threonine protein kinase